MKEGTLDLKGTYGDSALVLSNDGDPNQYLARDLVSQIKQGRKYPLMIPLADLDLVQDQNSPDKLAFKLTDSGLIYAPQFENSNNGKKFKEGDNNGLPIFDENGTRTLYTGEGGLRRLHRNWDLDLDAGDWGLAYSGGVGRVIVCAEGTRA